MKAQGSITETKIKKMNTKEVKQIRICSCHDEQIPLIWTFAFNGSEYWCPACGFNGGMFGSGESVDSTKELRQLRKDWEKKSRKFLDAKSTLSCDALKIKGVFVKRRDIPQKLIDKCKKIVSEWEYEIK